MKVGRELLITETTYKHHSREKRKNVKDYWFGGVSHYPRSCWVVIVVVVEKKCSLTLRGWCAVSQTQGIYQNPGSLSTRFSILAFPRSALFCRSDSLIYMAWDLCKPASQCIWHGSKRSNHYWDYRDLDFPESLSSSIFRVWYLSTFSISLFLMFSSLGTTMSIMKPLFSWWSMRMMS